MPDLAASMVEPKGGFPIQGMMMRYNLFMPRLYNWCLSLGFESGKIMPSRAFCSDESQGYPIIMMTKHFGTFPFNHGRTGGVVSTRRHGPHADHGQDMVIVHASHVGYDPHSKTFGTYRRLQTANQNCGTNCGKLHYVTTWYQDEYLFAQQNILLHKHEGKECLTIDNHLLREDIEEGLLLHLDKLTETDENGLHVPINMLSTSKTFMASADYISRIGKAAFTEQPQPIGNKLESDMFYFRRNITEEQEGEDHLDHNLIRYMPQIITSPSPILTAAQINTQIEFDRTFRTIVKEHAYRGKKVLFISGLNIDISPEKDQMFPLTKFVPWAAYSQEPDDSYTTFEQSELAEILENQSTSNPNQIDLETAILSMAEAKEVKVES